jgi:hypothetical protein
MVDSCARCGVAFVDGEIYLEARLYSADPRGIAALDTVAIHPTCPTLPEGATALPAFDPLAFIVCWRPECGHTAAAHGMVWRPTEGSIEITDPAMACTALGCPCQAFDQGSVPETIAQRREQE